MQNIPVIIAGGGPVGMTLALVLAHHGVRSILLEQRPTTTSHPKMDLTNGRSMEIFRILGIADNLRKAGVDPHDPLDVVWATRLSGHILHRFAYPSPVEQREAARTANDGTYTAEPSMRVSQIVLEPVLKAEVDRNPLIDVRFGCAFDSFEQDADGVTVRVRRDGGAAFETLRCDYLAGCDGGGSRVRSQLGITMEGAFAVAQAYMVHFKSRDHDVVSRFGKVYHLQTGGGTLIAQDGIEHWTLQTILPPEIDPGAVDPAELLRSFIGQDFDFEIIVANPWTPHMVVAEKYRYGRVVLAGDSVHQVIPTGGYGMNTGIGDAFDLGWKLAAILNGWGGPQLLVAYEEERRQIGLQNRAAAMTHADARMAITMLIVEAEATGCLDGEHRADDRAVLGAQIAALGNAENESWGIEHGYRYEGSPINVTSDVPGDAPVFDPAVSRPSTYPGSRIPHLYLPDGTLLYDRLGKGFSLLVVGDEDFDPLVQVAAKRAVPLSVVALSSDILPILETKFVLVRPDQHVAWRGDHLPDDVDALLSVVTGWRVLILEPVQ
jgi:2-polyprenyl-6-methoxyphenol hydroxylase-like FAD-dependent oxidoreductase